MCFRKSDLEKFQGQFTPNCLEFKFWCWKFRHWHHWIECHSPRKMNVIHEKLNEIGEHNVLSLEWNGQSRLCMKEWKPWFGVSEYLHLISIWFVDAFHCFVSFLRLLSLLSLLSLIIALVALNVFRFCLLCLFTLGFVCFVCLIWSFGLVWFYVCFLNHYFLLLQIRQADCR